MQFIYNILFEVGFILLAPYYFLRMRRRGGWRRGFGERLGRYSTEFKQAISNRDVVWLHAVSVGEANICGVDQGSPAATAQPQDGRLHNHLHGDE